MLKLKRLNKPTNNDKDLNYTCLHESTSKYDITYTLKIYAAKMYTVNIYTINE